MSNEEFYNWWKKAGIESPTIHETGAAKKAWQARQPEIDALKEKQRLFEADNATLRAEIDALNAEVERLRQKIDAPSFFLLGISGSSNVPDVFRKAALMHHQSLDAAMKEPKS